MTVERAVRQAVFVALAQRDALDRMRRRPPPSSSGCPYGGRRCGGGRPPHLGQQAGYYFTAAFRWLHATGTVIDNTDLTAVQTPARFSTHLACTPRCVPMLATPWTKSSSSVSGVA
ncbi:hypothetical protein GCM10018773_62970 [Streptomyces candidus]|nr:hypothetical protein GCM10018773_62970 [Streptomyces candidus]